LLYTGHRFVIYRAPVCYIQGTGLLYTGHRFVISRAPLYYIQGTAFLYTEHRFIIYRAPVCYIQGTGLLYTGHRFVIYRAPVCYIHALKYVLINFFTKLINISLYVSGSTFAPALGVCLFSWHFYRFVPIQTNKHRHGQFCKAALRQAELCFRLLVPECRFSSFLTYPNCGSGDGGKFRDEEKWWWILWFELWMSFLLNEDCHVNSLG
jgi:hypothetical protein